MTRALRRMLLAPIRFLNWIYVRRPFEPESQWRRTVDAQAASQQKWRRLVVQEVLPYENALRARDDARDARLLTVRARRHLDAAVVVLLTALAAVVVGFAFWNPADPLAGMIVAALAVAGMLLLRRWFR